ncbi:four-carbon acid sugar kinase family protein [Acuticoccus kandeliae]|uniref:four-carbon acid sugar kinase family protein n=1 Tax=Acuticoccus kandeliae TaxID=2073160 RepID=UPI000D3ECF2A|nr:four-carbon acid sugar kinase family protein [Acuticoccus kandeliae]
MSETGRRVLLAYYGDDFTGSTDAMEVTALAGLRTVLFTRVPDAATLARFSGYDVYGIAGTSRAQSPEWMDAHLPAAFEALVRLDPRLVQYKVCSTFDSSPTTGSIGRAIDLGVGVVGGAWSPSIVGAPQLGRWQAFGNLFAAAGPKNYRIDRHPTMSRHPVTPMNEGDLRRHLAGQTDRPIDGVDFVALDGFDPARIEGPAPVVFLDVLDPASQARAGEIVWEAPDARLFSASSSGLQYALVAHWRQTGRLPATPPVLPEAAPVARLLVLSGSCSPITADQIAHAEDAGFAAIRLDVRAAATPARAEAERARIGEAVAAAFQTARGVIVYAARSVDDPAYAALQAMCAETGLPFAEAQDALGRFLGALAREAVPRFGLERLVVAGGDTSGRIVESLPIDALEVAHPLVRGAPLCRCHSASEAYDGLQVALKGGQMGSADVFVKALGGAAAPAAALSAAGS